MLGALPATFLLGMICHALMTMCADDRRRRRSAEKKMERAGLPPCRDCVDHVAFFDYTDYDRVKASATANHARHTGTLREGSDLPSH